MASRLATRPSVEGVCRACKRRCASVALTACPDCGGIIAAAPPVGRSSLAPPMLFQSNYVWFVFVSLLDLMLTAVVLGLEGAEVNPVADAVLQHAGVQGLMLFKLSLVVFVIIMCEWVARRNLRAGRKLSEWSIAITSIPVIVSLYQLMFEI
jgi:hypothetical protein